MKKAPILVVLSLSLYGCSNIGGELIPVEANSDFEFNFPYFLFIPEEAAKNSTVSLIVEPNNSGFTSDDFDDHLDQAKGLASNRGNLGNFLAHEMGYPLLVPVFPRENENWRIYTHALDRDVMLQKQTSLERIDLQLLSMVEDANKRLVNMGFSVKDDFLITGFSASGTFSNRFSMIHPTKVSICIAGGLNGILMFPTDSIDNTALNYPLGTNDFFEVTGQSFDSTAFQNMPQFLFMGELDDNDAAQYGDAYSEEERAIIFNPLGESMQPDRWEICMNEYKNRGINAELRTYSEIGHTINTTIRKDILNFVRKNID